MKQVRQISDQWVLGISAFFHDAAAALVCGDQIIACAQEERFSRRKADERFPQQAIDYCLSQLPEQRALDAVAYYENPKLKLDRIFSQALENYPRGAPIWPKSLSTVARINRELPQQLLGVINQPDKVYFAEHHQSHAASAFYTSGFDEAAILVVDGVGEWASTSIWSGRDRQLTRVKEIAFPHSLGLLYSAFTQYCGFKVNSGEYKLMGLAPFGEPKYRQLIYDELIDVKADGSYALNLDYFEFHIGVNSINPLFEQLFKQRRRKPESELSPFFMDVAASIQAVLNEVMLLLAKSALAISSSRRLCMAGGVALNCVANHYLLKNLPDLSDLWIQPAAGDAGGALGAALSISQTLCQRDFAKQQQGKPKTTNSPSAISRQMRSAYWGPEYSEREILDTLDDYGLSYQNFHSDRDALNTLVVEALIQGQIIGYFDGRMEFGPRALGHRSILADPRSEHIRERVNARIKYRENWRPFAPIILEEKAQEFFDFPIASPHMLFVAEILAPFRRQADNPSHSKLKYQTSQFPAISHFDFTSRLQTLASSDNPRLYQLIQSFYQKTDCPMLLNTSFNVRGEPMICSPRDAVEGFIHTQLDLLVMGNVVVLKQEQSEAYKKNIKKRRFADD